MLICIFVKFCMLSFRQYAMDNYMFQIMLLVDFKKCKSSSEYIYCLG